MAKKNTDTVPAMLTPGEFVIKRESAKKIGYSKLNQMNKTGKVNNKKEAKMPQGKGTYGSKVGRPPRKVKVKGYAEGDKVKKGGGDPYDVAFDKPEKKKKEGKFDLPDYIKKSRAKRKKEGKWVFGKYAGKAFSAVKKGVAKEKARQKQYEIKSKKEQYESGQKSKDPKVRKATKAGYKQEQAGIAKKKAAARKKLESPKEVGSVAYRKMAKLGDASKFKLEKPKKKVVKKKVAVKGREEGKGKGAKVVKTKAQKTAANKSWKSATAASKKAGVKMTDLISQRKKHKKGTPAYAAIQNKINEFYGVKKRHKVEKKQFGGKISGGISRDRVEFDEDMSAGISSPRGGASRGYSEGGQVTSEGYPVHGGNGNYKVGE